MKADGDVPNWHKNAQNRTSPWTLDLLRYHQIGNAAKVLDHMHLDNFIHSIQLHPTKLPSSHSMSGNQSAARNGGGPARTAGRQKRPVTRKTMCGLDAPAVRGRGKWDG